MSTLAKIQKVMHVLSIIVRVVMICAFIGGGLLLVAGIVCLCVDDFTMAKELQRLLVDVGDYTHTEVGLALLADAVLLLANGIMLIFAVVYFNTELKDGTPFTLAGAASVRRMGIARIVATIVADLVSSLLTSFVDTNLLYSIESVSGLFFGVALILASLIFRHGAELQAQLNLQNVVPLATPTLAPATAPETAAVEAPTTTQTAPKSTAKKATTKTAHPATPKSTKTKSSTHA